MYSVTPGINTDFGLELSLYRRMMGSQSTSELPLHDWISVCASLCKVSLITSTCHCMQIPLQSCDWSHSRTYAFDSSFKQLKVNYVNFKILYSFDPITILNFISPSSQLLSFYFTRFFNSSAILSSIRPTII